MRGAVRFCGVLEDDWHGGCGVSVGVGLGTPSADFGERSGDPRGALAAPLPPPSPGGDARCPTPPLRPQPACARAGGRCLSAAGTGGCSLFPLAKAKRAAAGPLCCCWRSAAVGERPCLKQALLSSALPPR